MPMPDLQEDIKQQLSELDSELDVVAVEQPGVDLALCERVTKHLNHLNHLRADYSLEVSSPGPKYSRATQSTEVKETP